MTRNSKHSSEYQIMSEQSATQTQSCEMTKITQDVGRKSREETITSVEHSVRQFLHQIRNRVQKEMEQSELSDDVNGELSQRILDLEHAMEQSHAETATISKSHHTESRDQNEDEQQMETKARNLVEQMHARFEKLQRQIEETQNHQIEVTESNEMSNVQAVTEEMEEMEEEKSNTCSVSQNKEQKNDNDTDHEVKCANPSTQIEWERMLKKVYQERIQNSNEQLIMKNQELKRQLEARDHLNNEKDEFIKGMKENAKQLRLQNMRLTQQFEMISKQCSQSGARLQEALKELKALKNEKKGKHESVGEWKSKWKKAEAELENERAKVKTLKKTNETQDERFDKLMSDYKEILVHLGSMKKQMSNVAEFQTRDLREERVETTVSESISVLESIKTMTWDINQAQEAKEKLGESDNDSSDPVGVYFF